MNCLHPPCPDYCARDRWCTVAECEVKHPTWPCSMRAHDAEYEPDLVGPDTREEASGDR